MRIVLTKLSDQSHRLELFRDDGSCECVELETRSLLLHDLVHYAIEAQAEIGTGFYGLLASGTTLAELKDRDNPPSYAGLAMAESLVGPMQSLYNGRASRALYVENGRAKYPDVVDDVFVDAVLEQLRRLVGHWRATAYGAPMELVWPPTRTGAGA
jgi:hypothetical protein